jgi:para-aminobenzoate synthetase/4-amino-4-deoxychorismate lyase
VIASASPELFFEREGTLVRARPMKGTAPRGLDLEDDAAAAAALRASDKDRAENLMILDMLRNDLGRVADVGSVEVGSLFEIERYPTLLQMTSTVTARSAAPLSSLLEALFPCASVTGAPKASTMRLLARCERTPRGVYTGAIGWAAPDGRASFNVAIRTAVADRERGTLSFGTGSGIVADSVAARERDECLLKARVLEEEPFALLETLALLPGEGPRSLARHLVRVARSAEYFSIPLDGPALQARLRDLAARESGPRRVRVLVNANGQATIAVADLPPPPSRPLRVGFAREAVVSSDRWLRHKTTRRAVYARALASRPDCEDVLLWNERGEVTEASVASVVFALEGREVTPPLSCGLLPGVERGRLLAAGELHERVVRRDELLPGCRFWLVSSLRGRREAVLVE